MRVARFHTVQPHQGQHFGHTRGTGRGRQVAQAKGDVAPHVQVRKQRVVLEHHANAALLGRHVQRGTAHGVFFQLDLAAVDALQPRHRAQQRGFAAARGANQHPDIARAQAQRHVVDRGVRRPSVADGELRDVQEHAPHCR